MDGRGRSPPRPNHGWRDEWGHRTNDASPPAADPPCFPARESKRLLAVYRHRRRTAIPRSSSLLRESVEIDFLVRCTLLCPRGTDPYCAANARR
jgi:hypothetical protein